MSDRTILRIALAEAISNQLWVKGLITKEQQDIIDKKSKEILKQTDC